MTEIIYFLISVIFTRYCSLLSNIFGHVPMVNVCRCDLFGQVQIFRSYSFGHHESVMWVFLTLNSIKLFKYYLYLKGTCTNCTSVDQRLREIPMNTKVYWGVGRYCTKPLFVKNVGGGEIICCDVTGRCK